MPHEAWAAVVILIISTGAAGLGKLWSYFVGRFERELKDKDLLIITLEKEKAELTGREKTYKQELHAAQEDMANLQVTASRVEELCILTKLQGEKIEHLERQVSVLTITAQEIDTIKQQLSDTSERNRQLEGTIRDCKVTIGNYEHVFELLGVKLSSIVESHEN